MSTRARTSRALAVAGALALGAGGLAWGGVADAAPRSPAHLVAHTKKTHTKKKRHDRLPVIENAKKLSAEPVVHATKGSPPKKLLVKNLVVGTGPAVTDASTVTVKYVGASYKTGKDFTQATWTDGKATTFSLSGVIVGFAEGLVGMKVGGRREIVIPPKLGYRDTASGPIKANETLVFVVDLEGVSS